MAWAHAPLHKLDNAGAFIVTAGTYHKEHYLNSHSRKDRFLNHLFQLADYFGWKLQAWAVMSNHYHFVGVSETPESLPAMINKLHSDSAQSFNEDDGAYGRKVWHQYWDTNLTTTKSYYSRLKYVHDNPIHHGLVDNAMNYPWCSKGWFIREASSGFKRTIDSFKVDKISIRDDF